ncbi:MAG: bifunctional demethylmenaquinone methyltransferase/2-methoxy-6-polyprenyl-1,4-benzoquinol methylase UbiE [Phycisphaerales bacterium]
MPAEPATTPPAPTSTPDAAVLDQPTAVTVQTPSTPAPLQPACRPGATALASDPHAWTSQELTDPHSHTEKAGKVRRMFAAIAGSYDLNNRVHSLGLDQRWRRFAVAEAAVRAGDRVLDVACGTGDLTQAFATTEAAEIVGLDFTREMIELARKKQLALPEGVAGRLRYIEGDAQHLPFEDRSFDVISIAFGIRNVEDPTRALREFARVLRPGGRLVILEFDRPENPLVRWFNSLYCRGIMPRTATWLSGDKSGAYKYLPASVATFLAREALLDALKDEGFSHGKASPLSLGICVCYRAVRV